MKWSNFSYLCGQGFSAVWHNRMMSAASFCILMVSLLLIGSAVLFGADAKIVIGNIEAKNEILVFLDKGLNQSEINHISDVLSNSPYKKSVTFRSKEDAFKRFREEMGDKYFVLFDSLGENPMPDTFVVSLTDLTKIEKTAEGFREIKGVENVDAPYAFAQFLTSIRNTLTVIGVAIFVALILVCLVIIHNTARVSVFSRRTEINIMKHVGATNAFIKFPFFIEGMSIGVAAGAVAWFLTKLAYEAIIRLFMGDFTIWSVIGMDNLIMFDKVTWLVLLGDCAAGALLGALGTVMSMGKHLKV